MERDVYAEVEALLGTHSAAVPRHEAGLLGLRAATVAAITARAGERRPVGLAGVRARCSVAASNESVSLCYSAATVETTIDGERRGGERGRGRDGVSKRGEA